MLAASLFLTLQLVAASEQLVTVSPLENAEKWRIMGSLFLDGLIGAVEDLFTFPLGRPSPDMHETFEEIVKENGFAFESKEVTTEDGYILNVFHIMNAT